VVNRLVDARSRALWLALALTAAAVGVALMAAPAAQSNFTTAKCNGSNITGRGASFANAAHTAWISNFQSTYCPGGPTVTYDPAGSGAGRRVMGERTSTNATGVQSRNQVPRFGMTDEPPFPLGQGQMNTGTDTVGDEGTIHVVPAAEGSVVVTVNFPNNCDRALLPDSAETNPGSANASPFVDRVRFTRAQLDLVWAGDNAADNWTEVFPSLAADADCNVDITRVVRFDDSGTTFTLKDYLDHINGGRGWTTTFITPNTLNWPDGPGVGDRDDCGNNNGIPEPADPDGPRGDKLTSACSNGNGPLAVKLQATDGGIGYGDIATVRSNGYAITPAATAGARDDDLFWTQAPNPSGTFKEATDDPNGFRTDGSKGADCDTVTFNGTPATTTGDWSATSGVDDATGYVICTLTYGLVFDDYEPPYSLEGSGFASEEQKARTVKDYWTFVLSETGQNLLPPNDYDRLPTSILAKSRTGIGLVCFDKAGSGNCPTPTGAGPTYPRPSTGTPTRVPLVLAYSQCTSPNSTHVLPLALPSCNPPVRTSTQLTMGNVGQGSGFAKYQVLVGNPATTADEADIALQAQMLDVRNASGGTDYTGLLNLTSQVRITDLSNGAYEASSGTVQDAELSFPVQCVATGGGAGAACNFASTVDAQVPGFAKEGKNAIIDMQSINVEDAGPNGTLGPGCPRVCGDGDESVFLNSGVFLP
jgi:ABC-type phosphate transport system substrate-binding protein